MLGLRHAPSGNVEVTVPATGSRRRRGIKVHTTRSEIESVVIEGIRCTTPMRTLVDLAAVLNEHQLRRTLERALELDVFDRFALDAVLAHPDGRQGTKLLRRLLADLSDEPFPTASEIERRFLELIREAGLPYPVVNGHIGVLQVDFHWPAHRLVVETDGRATHGHVIAFHRDRDRDLELSLAGWHVIRLTWRQILHEPERVVAALRRRLDSR